MSANFVRLAADFNLRALKPGIQKAGFSEQVRIALGFDRPRKKKAKRAKTLEGDDNYDAWLDYRPAFVPDYFCIETIDEVVTVSLFEVEDTHPLTSSKIRDVVEWWFSLDSLGADVKLFVTDRYGLTVREILLEPLWLVFTRQEYNEQTRALKRSGVSRH